MYSLGIDIGSATVKAAVINTEHVLDYQRRIPHKGAIASSVHEILTDILSRFGKTAIIHGAVTGSGSSYLTRGCAASSINEVAALVDGALFMDQRTRSVIEIGSQSAKYITGFTPSNRGAVRISMNPNCASGTGSFLESQVARLKLDIRDYASLAGKAAAEPRIAGRCSVFAKTDITHHQQEGVGVEDILKGLAYALVRNYRSAVMRRLPRKPPFLFAGGVARNGAISEALLDVLQLEEKDLLVPNPADMIAAIGAAVLAGEAKMSIDPEALLGCREPAGSSAEGEGAGVTLFPLRRFGERPNGDKHACRALPAVSGPVDCWLGVDVGSTSTNLVLADQENNIISYRYLRTAGNPRQAVQLGLRLLRDEFGERVRVKGAATTGSGRYMIGKLIGADVLRDEITAQARAAVALDGEVDTIFEIGGQDSKFIAIDNGVVTDFQMNKVCAAGTGSFIEEQAGKLGLDLDAFESAALDARQPEHLGERCAVFMETNIATRLADGASTGNIAAGLCYAIVKNYLNKVAGGKRIGRKIFFQGGVAHNRAVVNAFRAVTGKSIIVPPFFSVTGAFGAAILAREEMGDQTTRFKGFDAAPSMEMIETPVDGTDPNTDSTGFNDALNDFIFKLYTPEMNPAQKTVGIPRALFTFGMFPMFYPFFKELGVNVRLSDPTHETTLSMAREYALDETCYPVKLLNGHAAELIERGVDYLFLPDLYTANHPTSRSRQTYGCAYMQLAFKMISRAMDLETRGIELLAPTIAFSLGMEFMQRQFVKLGRRLGRSDARTMAALQTAMQAFRDHESRVMRRRHKMTADIYSSPTTFVLISKIYGMIDPALNLGIPDRLMKMGHRVIPSFDLPETDIFEDYPNMFWPFGQHILSAAKTVRAHPNLYAIFLSHHGCGPDSVTSHYFREIMGGKPYLHIEVDEHASAVGVITRVEAFANSLKRTTPDKHPAFEAGAKATAPRRVPVQTTFEEPWEGPLYLPNLQPYTRIAAEIMTAVGMPVQILDSPGPATIDRGKKHVLTNEYFSLTALLGETLMTLEKTYQPETPGALLFPQSEGAEVDGQYSRFLRTKLDEAGFDRVEIIAPFMEDLSAMQREPTEWLFYCLLAGDLVMAAPPAQRDTTLTAACDMFWNRRTTLKDLGELARRVQRQWCSQPDTIQVFAVGEPLVLYNDFLNNGTLNTLEARGFRVTRAPMSEYLWATWCDHARQNAAGTEARVHRHLDSLLGGMDTFARILGPHSPFSRHPARLRGLSDQSVGYYAGAFGRYRQARLMDATGTFHGVITVSSMYENTGISLGILQNQFSGENGPPILNLSFDGNENATDKAKLDTFIYYLNNRKPQRVSGTTVH